MKKPVIVLLGAVSCCTQAVSAAVTTTDNTSVDLYVQDGLIGHWDAIDNGGRGIHNTSTNIWVNLAPADKEGRIDDITLYTAAITIKDNALFKKGNNGKGLFGYINGKQPTNVATFEGTISGITNVLCSHQNYGGRPLLSLMTISKWQQVILAPTWLRYSRSSYPEVPDVRTNDYAFVFDNGGASAEHGGPNPKRFNPTFGKRLDALTIAATYDHPMSGNETCVYDESYVNGEKLQRLANFSADWSYPEDNSGNTTFGGRISTTTDSNENKTYNYSMHSIRLYNRKLGVEEVRKNAFVDHYRFEGAVSGVDVVSDGEGAYAVTGTFVPLDFEGVGDMTVKITELSAVNELETVREFTVAPEDGGVCSFPLTPRCLVTVTVSQTYVSQAYGEMTLEKSISGLKTWEEGGTAGNNSWLGEWTDPVTSWYAAPEKWSAGRFPIAGDKLTIGNEANKSYAVRIGVPVSVSAGKLNIASMVGQSNRLEIANGAELSLGNGELCMVTVGANDKKYGELILSNGTLKVGKLTGGYSNLGNHLGRIVVDGNSQLLVSGDAWIGGQNTSAPFGGWSHVAMLVRGGSVEVTGSGTPASTGSTGFFYGSSVPLTIEGGKITTTKLAFSATINMSGGEIATPFGLIFNNSGDGARMNQSGGRFSGMIGVDRPAGYYTISGGEFDCETFASGARNNGTADRSLLFRTVGSKPKVSIASYFNNGDSTHRNWFMFWDYALGADGRVSAHENAATSVFGYYHVAPLGGVQLIHTNCVTLVHNAEKDLVEDTTQRSGYGIKTLSGDMWDYGISADKRRMEATLKPDFKLTNGALLDTSVDRGYLDLSDQLAPGVKGLKSVTVKLALEPQTGTTLNDIIAKINESGAGTASAIDEGDWNVQVEVPVKSVEKIAGERVVLDFTEYNTFKSMATPTPTVRAKIKGARVTVLRKGLIMMVF